MEHRQVAVGVHELHGVVAAVGIELDGDSVDAGDLVSDRGFAVRGVDRTPNGHLVAGDGNGVKHGLLVLFCDAVSAECFEAGPAALIAGGEVREVLIPLVRCDNFLVHGAASIT